LVEDLEKGCLIQRIIDSSLGELAHWQRPVSLPSIGPAFPEVYSRFENELSEWRAKTKERLELWSLRELAEISPESEAPSLNPMYDERGRLGSAAIALRRLKAFVPQDFVGGWAVAGKEIDLTYWTSFASVSLNDLVFLSLGREPRKASYLAACETYGRSDEGDTVLYFLEDRLELVANAMGLDPEDHKAKVELKAFFDWVEETKLPIDHKFHLALRNRFRPEALSATTEVQEQPSSGGTKDTKFDPRERSSFLKLITAMAMDVYGYDPTAARSPIPKEIEDIALRLGLQITADTIRKILREGSQYLPEGWNQNRD
jgi:hypothetical protein